MAGFVFNNWCSEVYTIRTLQHSLRRPTSSSAAGTQSCVGRDITVEVPSLRV